MRIGCGGFAHETNAFGNILVDEALMAKIKYHARDFWKKNSGVRNGCGGFIDEAAKLNIELVPTVFANPGPSGPATQPVFESFRDELVELLWQAHCEKSLDGIALDLHGAGYAIGYDDLEGELLRAIRSRFGMAIPIATKLDLHGNISQEMIDLCDITVGFKSYPHVDDYECGRTTLQLLHNMIEEGTHYGKALVQLPWSLACGFGVTLSGAARKVKEYMAQLVQEEPELLDATFFHGFPYADVPCAGVSVVTCARTQEAAQRYAQQIARFAWDIRREFTAPLNSAAEAMDQAEKAESPVVINESSDNPGGGSPADGTHLLREMLRRNLPGSAFGYIRDAEVVKQAVAAGVGSTISCKLGAKSDKLHGEPIELENAYVKCISDGRFIQKNPMGAGGKCNWGPMVLLVVGNVQIVVSPARSQTLDDAPFYLTGIDWTQQRILALKSSHHFKGWWYGRAKTIIPCDSPGVHSSDLSTFKFKKLNTSYYPFCNANWE